MRDSSPPLRTCGSASGPVLKGGIDLRLCSCVMWVVHPGHGFAPVILCGWVMTWVLVNKSLFSLMMWREACKLKTSTMWKFEYESCQNHMAVGEKMSLFHPEHSLAVSHACLSSQGEFKDVFRMALAQVGSLYVHHFLCSSPSLFPFVTKVLRVTGIFQHCNISIFVLIYPFSVHSFFSYSKQGNDSYLPFHPLQRVNLKTILVTAPSPALRQQWPLLWPAATLSLKLLVLLWHSREWVLLLLCSLSTDLQK